MKRIAKLLLLAALAATSQAEDYPLWVGGVQFTAGNLVIDADDDPEIASGTATFDPASNTLSLTNFVYSGAGHSWTVEPGTENEHICAACIFYSGADALAVALSGTNSVALSAADPAPYSSFGFRSGNYRTAVSFAGAGSLSARAGAAANLSHGVSVFGPLAVAAGAEVAGAAGAAPSSGGVVAHGMIEVGGRLAGTGGASDTSEGIACYTMGMSEVVVSEGASVAAAGGAARLSHGILAHALTVNGGEVTAEGGEATTRSRALYPTSGDFVLAVADGWQVLAGEDADGAAPVEDDAWRTARYVRVAPAAYPVWVAGRQVTGANAANVLGDASASVSFAGTATNGTLTLRDAVIEEPFGYVPGQSNYGYIAIYTKSGSNFALTVALEGTNRVGSAEFAYGFQTWSPLTITGGGVLFAVADDVAIFSYPSVLIDGATVFAEGRGSGGRGSRGWGIADSGFAATNATVQATGASVGITANGVWIGGDSTVVAEGGTAALGCYPPENFSLGDGLAVLEPAGGTPDLYVPALGRIFISSGGAAATRVVIGPPPPAVAATVTFNNGSGAVVYDGQGHGVEVEVTDPAEGAAVLFALGDSSGPTETFGPTAPMFTNVCDETVWVELSAEGYRTTTISAAVTIARAALAITAKDQTYAYNGQTQGEGDTLYATPGDIAEKVAVSGLAPGDGLASIILDGQGTDPGTYPLVPSGATVTNAVGAYVTDNYAIGYTNGTLTIREPPPPFVSNVVARQRWPWNGLVDVDYEVGGSTTGLVARISFAEQGGAGRSWVASNFLAGAEPSAAPGAHRATWDTAADGATNVVAAKVTATVELVRKPPVSDGNVWSLIGDFNSWAGDVDMTLTDGKWVSPVTKITAGGFKIRYNHDWTENVGGVMEAPGTPFAAIAGGDEIAIEEENDYVVTYDPEDQTILVEVIGWGIVGTINSWGGSVDLAMKEENGMFVRKNVTLTADDEIKVRYCNSWDVNYGGRTDVGFAVEAISGSDNLKPGAGTYDIWLDAEKKALFVMKAGEAPKYWGVVGTINGWGGTPDAVMYHDAEGYFVAKGITLAAGDEIKIRKNSDWTDNRGASDAAPDTALDAVAGGDNIKVAAGTYDVYYQSASEKIYVMTAGKTPADAQ